MFINSRNNESPCADADLECAIGINRFTLEMLGLWPDEKLNRHQKVLANLRAFVIFTTMVAVSIIPSYFSIMRVLGDMMAIIDNLQITLPCSVAAMKIIIMRLRKEGKNAITIAATASSLRGTLDINHILKID